ncbi:hypothetical protein [Oceanobacillus jordanicus]|uniref:hypothetical protein n=1 Tax=Oceanobacillus jordanicus TaxID=2867266 RepID=UPI001EDD95BC|nr:hypothetical protein [Oceanobacillus jordanicus]
MLLKDDVSNLFEDVYTHVKESAEKLGSSGVALFIIHNDKVVTESYFGKQSNAKHARDVKADRRLLFSRI